MRLPAVDGARALVVGVYPSAFHVAWSPPGDLDQRDVSRRRRPMIGSLAVDVEPVVFWDGVTPSPDVELERWRADVHFDQGHGRVSVGNNGPSGAGLVKHFLAPLGIETANVAFTDVVPWFFVKGGRASQGEAISARFAPVAAHMGVHGGSLPSRPAPRKLVEIAASDRRRDSLRAEVLEADAPLVITLGQEALDSVIAVADEVRGVQSVLSPDGYGTIGDVLIAHHRMDLLPLAHPGFLRQTSSERWRSAFNDWSNSLGFSSDGTE